MNNHLDQCQTELYAPEGSAGICCPLQVTLGSSGPTINNAIIYREYFNLYFQNNIFNTEMVQEYQFTLKVRKGHELEALHRGEQNVITVLPISRVSPFLLEQL